MKNRLDFYFWIAIVNLVSLGYLIKLLIDTLVGVVLLIKENKMNLKLISNNLFLEFRNRMGIGTLSIVVFVLGFVWLSGCDGILSYLNIRSWTNGNTGQHIGSCYALLFFIPSYIIAIKYRSDWGAKTIRKLSGLFSLVYLATVILFMIY